MYLNTVSGNNLGCSGLEILNAWKIRNLKIGILHKIHNYDICFRPNNWRKIN